MLDILQYMMIIHHRIELILRICYHLDQQVEQQHRFVVKIDYTMKQMQEQMT